MIKREPINNSKEKFTILECNQCKKLLVLPDMATNEVIESKNWYIERKKSLALCPIHNKTKAELEQDKC